MSAVQLPITEHVVRTLETVQFLHREARLLDEERWREWLELLTPDVHYWVPVVQSLYRRAGGVAIDPEAIAFFDDSYEDLSRRVARFEQETAWAEDPPTRCAHVVSNVEVSAPGESGEYCVDSIVTLHRCRNENEAYQTVARRHDVLRRSDGVLKIARRRVVLLETVLLAKNLNTFF